MTSKMNSPLIEIQSLNFCYRGRSSPALQNIRLNARQGECVVIMGPNEAGKSTLCFTLNGLIPHLVKGSFEGKVLIEGIDTREEGVKHFFRHVGLVFQDFEAQLFSTAVELEVAFGPENLGLSFGEIDQRTKWALEMTGLTPLCGRQPATLSGGQKQLLAIASVLSLRPKILCLDEPTTDLDPVNRQRIFSLTKKLAGKNQTLIIVEHETEEALSADRIVLLRDGAIIAEGPPQVLFRNIPLLEQCSIMPLQLTELFDKLGFRELPLTTGDASDLWHKHSLALPAQTPSQLEAIDQAKGASYGRTLIEVKDVHFSYEPGAEVVSGAHISIREGEFIAILGQNGSGKTTLAKLLTGLLKPGQGNVRVAGMDTARASIGKLGHEVGYVFQNPDHQIFKETILDEILFGPRNLGFDDAQAEQQARDALETVGLWERRLEDPFTLPKGLRQKVAVASVLASRPRAIIMDEPTTGLDYSELKQMMALVRRLNEAGHTIIIITHCIWIAAQYPHRIILMSRGKIVADGSTRRVLSQESLLQEADVRAPQIVRFSNSLGCTILSVDEFLSCYGTSPLLRESDTATGKQEEKR